MKHFWTKAKQTLTVLLASALIMTSLPQTGAVVYAEGQEATEKEGIVGAVSAEDGTVKTAPAEKDTVETAPAEEDTVETAPAEKDTVETASVEEDTMEAVPVEESTVEADTAEETAETKETAEDMASETQTAEDGTEETESLLPLTEDALESGDTAGTSESGDSGTEESSTVTFKITVRYQTDTYHTEPEAALESLTYKTAADGEEQTAAIIEDASNSCQYVSIEIPQGTSTISIKPVL